MAKETRKYKDRREYLIKAVASRRRRLKEMAVEQLGGQCFFCGYKRDISALEFHHKNPLEKDFSLSKRGVTRSWVKVQQELAKCILVCANCHRELHSGLLQLPDESQE